MASSKKTRVGVIGCGNIAQGAYLPNLKKFPHLELVACADLNVELARRQAEIFAIPHALTPDELIAHPEVELVVNLTIPQAHVPIDLAALRAGKHVFSEKPYALTRSEGQLVSHEARQRGLRVGCAPDTVLGAGLQTCRDLIDAGAIGRPVSFAANMLSRGPEGWHPSPEFFYQRGGGPLLDMGPYYLHALITLLGPVSHVSAVTRITFPERVITSQPKAGQVMRPEIPTHLSALLEMAGGQVGTLVTSFDIRGPNSCPRIEIYGEEGTLQVPDPNTFGGPVRVGKGKDEWRDVPLERPYSENSRGLGAADLASALLSGRAHRANDEIALHVVDIMQTIHEAGEEGCRKKLGSTCVRPQALPKHLPAMELD